MAKLTETSFTDVIRRGIETQVQTMSADPSPHAKADALRQEIEREAREQQGALVELFGSPGAPRQNRKP